MDRHDGMVTTAVAAVDTFVDEEAPVSLNTDRVEHDCEGTLPDRVTSSAAATATSTTDHSATNATGIGPECAMRPPRNYCNGGSTSSHDEGSPERHHHRRCCHHNPFLLPAIILAVAAFGCVGLVMALRRSCPDPSVTSSTEEQVGHNQSKPSTQPPVSTVANSTIHGQPTGSGDSLSNGNHQNVGESSSTPSNGEKPTETDPPFDSPTGTGSPTSRPSHSSGPPSGSSPGSSLSATAQRVEAVLAQKQAEIDNQLFLYQTPDLNWIPSTIYRYDGLISGLQSMHLHGIGDYHFYMGDDGTNGAQQGYLYGLVNVAAFLAQSMKETIQYDACDENSWDLVNNRYPISNACGQLRQSYQDYHCAPEEAHMECPVDPTMRIAAVTHAKWWGAPGPLQCGPRSIFPFTGYWDHTKECNQPWANRSCTDYPGQRGGGVNNDAPYANSAGRTDVEGCCWWGRGVIQTTGVCNFGKLNYFLGKRAADDGRPSLYPTIDFCKDPEIICSSVEHQELKWIAGMFYWMESVQTYNVGGWDYITELHKFVDGGMLDISFIDGVSGIVNRGCHNPPCGTGPLDGGEDRKANFMKVLEVFGLLSSEGPPIIGQPTPPTLPIITQPPAQPGDSGIATRPPMTTRPTANETAASLPPISAVPVPVSFEAFDHLLISSEAGLDKNIFIYKSPDGTWIPSTIYRFSGFISGLRQMFESGINGQFFYMGDGSAHGHLYALVNIAAFLAQSMHETIQYDACDENSWDLVNNRYPISNACGQLRQSYQDYHCVPEEAHMECPVDPTMRITAVTHAKWWGAPGPLQCGPRSIFPFTGYWDHTKECNQPWANRSCTDYPGQRGGGVNNDAPYANSAGRTDVEGCCWWGRGVIQTTGVCNFGKLNYFLGKRAADDGRPSLYPTIDFCKDPEIICSSVEHQELKWIAGMFYWMESVQTYNVGGWDYITELHKFVDGGLSGRSFIDSVSAIVNRGCHNPPCATGSVDALAERQENFHKVLREFGL